MVCDQEGILVSFFESTLMFIVVLDLLLDLLELLPFSVVQLLEHQFFDLHPGIHTYLIVDDVVVGRHGYEARCLSHELGAVLVIEVWSEDLHLVQRDVLEIGLVHRYLLVQAAETGEQMLIYALTLLPNHVALVVEIHSIVEGSA